MKKRASVRIGLCVLALASVLAMAVRLCLAPGGITGSWTTPLDADHIQAFLVHFRSGAVRGHGTYHHSMGVPVRITGEVEQSAVTLVFRAESETYRPSVTTNRYVIHHVNESLFFLLDHRSDGTDLAGSFLPKAKDKYREVLTHQFDAPSRVSSSAQAPSPPK